MGCIIAIVAYFGVALFVLGVYLVAFNWDMIRSWFYGVDIIEALLKQIERCKWGDVLEVITPVMVVLIDFILIFVAVSLTSKDLKHKVPILLNCLTGILWTVAVNLLDVNIILSIVFFALGAISVLLSFVIYADRTGVAAGFFGTIAFQVGLVFLPYALANFLMLSLAVVAVVVLVNFGRLMLSGIAAAVDSGQDVVGDIQRMRADMVADNSQHREAQPDRRDAVFENVRRTTGASPHDIKVNRDGSKFNVGGEWHSVSKDGSSYETSSGSWEKFRP